MASNLLKAIITADGSGLEDTVDDLDNQLNNFAKNADNAGKKLSTAFAELQKKGVVSIAGLQAAMKELKVAVSLATDPRELKLFNTLLGFLATQEKKLKGAGLDTHLEGVTRSTQRAATASLGFAKVINLFPPEIAHLTHGFDSVIEAYEQIRSKTETSGQAFGLLAKSLGGPLGIGIALSVGASLLETFGVKLFETSEEAKKAAEKLKELLRPIKEIASESAAGTAGESAKVNALVAVVQDQTKSYQERNNALLQLKEINKNYFGDLTLEASKLGLVKKAAEEYTNAIIQQAVIKGFQDEIGKVSVALDEQKRKFKEASKNVDDMKRSLDKAKEANKDVLVGGQGVGGTSDLREATTNLGKARANSNEAGLAVFKLRRQFEDLSSAINDAVEESLKLKPLTNPDDGKADDAIDKLIEKAKRLAVFLNRKTQFSVVFDVDPNDTKAETLDKAKKFFKKTKAFFEDNSSKFGTFLFKPIVAVEFKSLFTKQALLRFKKESETEFTKTLSELEKDLQKEIDQLVLTNPFLKLFKDLQTAADKRKAIQAELATSVGLNIEDINKPLSLLTKVQEAAARAANSITQLLVPAFQNLFSAILAGKSPLEAFFTSLKDSIIQLINKLIAAAIQALVLSAIFPGGIGGVKGFGGFLKNILGFRADGGPVSANSPYVVGERGPELFLPNTGGKIVPNHALGRGSAGSISQAAVNVNIIGRISGNDIILAVAKATRSQSRTT